MRQPQQAHQLLNLPQPVRQPQHRQVRQPQQVPQRLNQHQPVPQLPHQRVRRLQQVPVRQLQQVHQFQIQQTIRTHKLEILLDRQVNPKKNCLIQVLSRQLDLCYLEF